MGAQPTNYPGGSRPREAGRGGVRIPLLCLTFGLEFDIVLFKIAKEVTQDGCFKRMLGPESSV